MAGFHIYKLSHAFNVPGTCRLSGCTSRKDQPGGRHTPGRCLQGRWRWALSRDAAAGHAPAAARIPRLHTCSSTPRSSLVAPQMSAVSAHRSSQKPAARSPSSPSLTPATAMCRGSVSGGVISLGQPALSTPSNARRTPNNNPETK